MPERPYTILSCSISLDGYLGGAGEERLVLSNDADLDRVDHVRSGCDAILVGAGTVRDDNPRLLVRSPLRREQRRARGLAESPTKVTVTRHARLDAGSNFFATGDSEKIVYCASPALGTGEALAVQPHERHLPARVPQPDRHVLPRVDEAAEGEHPGRHRGAVRESQRQRHLATHDGRRDRAGDALDAHAVSSNLGERA